MEATSWDHQARQGVLACTEPANQQEAPGVFEKSKEKSSCKELTQQRCHFLHVEDTEQLAAALLDEEQQEHWKLLDALAKRIFKGFISITAAEKEAAHFAEIEQLGAPQDRDLIDRFLNSLLQELEDESLSFLYRLSALTKLFKRVEPSSLRHRHLIKILNIADALFERVPQVPGTESELRPFISALTALLVSIADANVQSLNGQHLEALYPKIEALTRHPDFEINTYAHIALQALLRLPHDDKKLAATLKRELSQRKAAPCARQTSSTAIMTMPAAEDFSTLLKFFNQFRAGRRAQNGQQIWYEAWHFAQFLLETRPFADFQKFFQEEPLFQTEDLLVNGCMVLLTSSPCTSHPLFCQKEALDFLKEHFFDLDGDARFPYLAASIYQTREATWIDRDIRQHAAALLESLEKQPALSQQQQQALTNAPSYQPLLPPAPLATSLFQGAQKTLQADSLPYWIALHQKKRLEKAREMFYVPLLASSDLRLQGQASNLEQKVRDFLASEKRILLLQGNAGQGKTRFTCFFEQALWKEYPASKLPPFYLPLYNLSQHQSECLTHTLQEEYSLSEQHIKELKEDRLLFLLDGYDEIKSGHHRIRGSTLVQEWPQARFLITCRSEFLTMSHYKEHFHITANNRFNPSALQELYLLPFSAEQIDTYLENYLQKQHSPWSFAAYKEALDILPTSLPSNPLLLSLLLQTLPELSSSASDLKKLTRTQLYDAFTTDWFNRQKIKLIKQHKHTDIYLDPNLQFANFATDLAYEMLWRGETAIEWRPEEEQPDWKCRFFAQHEQIIRSGCPLRKEGRSYAFQHASFLEYFAAKKIASPPPTPTTDSSLLGQRLFTQEGGLLSFLADHVHAKLPFQKRLFALIEASKSNSHSQQKIAAANALTILNFARISFSGLDLRGIQVPNAYLDHAAFDHTDLRGADLSRCSLRHAFLGGAQLEEAHLEDILLGEQAVLQHKDWVRSVCFSPDGQMLASASKDRTVRLWEVDSGQGLLTLRGHENEVNSVCFSPDGQMLASASDDRTVRLWAVASGQGLQKTLRGHEDLVWSVCFSPDGQMLASASGDDTVRLWQVSSGQELQTLRGHEDSVWSVCFSPDGQQLASSANEDRTVRLWEVASGQELQTLRGHEYGVWSVCFSPAGQQLASASDDRTVRLWEVASGQELQTLRGHEYSVSSVCFSPDGQQLASASDDDTVRLWQVSSGQELQTLRGHESRVGSVCFSPDGQMLASASDDRTVRLWEVESSQELQTLRGHESRVSSVCFSPDGQMLASASDDRTVRLWEVESSQELQTLRGHESWVRSVCFSPVGQQLASASKDRTVRLWEVASGQELQTLRGHEDSISSVCFSPDGQQLASASDDRTVRLWEVESSQELQTLRGHKSGVLSLCFSPAGQLLASASSDYTVRLWAVDSGQGLQTLRGHESGVLSVCFSPDGQMLASASGSTVRLWAVGSGQGLQTLRGHEHWINSVCFSPDGQMLASASFDRTVRLWAVGSGQGLQTLRGHENWVDSVCFSPDGQMLASAGYDRTVRTWKRGKEEKFVLQWSTPHPLFCQGMQIGGAHLSVGQQALLLQKGAHDSLSD